MPSPVGDRETHEIALHYPDAWLCPVNPWHFEVERDVESWLASVGVLDEVAARRFRLVSAGRYGGWSFPFASREGLELVTKHNTLWLFYDDIIEGLGDDDAARVAEATCGLPERFPGGNPCYRGWWEIGRECRRVMSPSWLARHRERFADWQRSVLAESRLVQRYRDAGVPPAAEELLAVRVTNIGVYSTIDFIEYDQRREMPPGFFSLPEVAEIERLASRLITYQNDLVGFTKDREGGWTNLVTSVAHEADCSLSDAFRRVAALHQHDVAALQAAQHRLLCRDGGEQASIWCRYVHSMVAGFAVWHVCSSRYTCLHRIDDHTNVHIIVCNAPQSIGACDG